MSDEQIAKTIQRGLAEKSEATERQLLGHSDDGLVGFALTAPDCVVMAYSLSPVPRDGAFFHFNLN